MHLEDQLRLPQTAQAIQDEYHRLDEQWLQMQYQANLWLVLIATLAEIVMFFVLKEIGGIGTTSERYFLKYVLTPFGVNVLFLVLARAALRSNRALQGRSYVVSLALVGCCFVCYTVHCIFPALYLIFAIPLMLTVVHADWKLTTMVAFFCIAGKAVSDLFIFWDAGKESVLVSQTATANFFMSLLILLVLYGVCLLMLRIERDKNNVSIRLESERQQLAAAAVTDALTGVGNRQALRVAFEQMESSKRELYALAMLDLDDFKSLNDQYGHARGDQYLRDLGSVLRELEDSSVQCFRFGGDEFCILFRGEACTRLTEVCGQLQSRFSAAEVHRRLRPVTVSIGTAQYHPGEAPTCLVERADEALYRAKTEKGSVQMSIL